MSPDKTSAAPTLNALPVATPMLMFDSHLSVATFALYEYVKVLWLVDVDNNSKPPPFMPASSNTGAFNSSTLNPIVLSLTRNSSTSIAVWFPSTVKFPEILTSPATSKLAVGLSFHTPT